MSSGGITGAPSGLPSGWALIDGYLVGPGANLANADLTGADLDGADLASAYLDGANLSDADLVGANFGDANLMNVISGGITGAPSALPSGWTLIDGYLVGPHANLVNADLANADLADVNLDESNLADADLNDAALTNANLEYAELSGANMAGADLTGVSSGGIFGTPAALPAPWLLANGYLVGPDTGLAGARLVFSDLVDADFTDDSLSGAILYGSDMSGADLSDADLTGANLGGADLTGDDLSNVTWSNTTCPDGSNSDSDGGTCVNDEQIDQSDPDLVAQTNLVQAFSSADSFYTSNDDSFAGLSPSDLAAGNPNVTFTTNNSSGPAVISMAVSTDGNGIILAADDPTTDSCWYVYDNQLPVTTTADSPWSSEPAGLNGPQSIVVATDIGVPATASVFYAEVNGDSNQHDCSAPQPVARVGSSYVAQYQEFPAL